MKKAKKFLALLTAMVMTLAVAIPAMAAETYTLTIHSADGSSEHKFTAYQIFQGTLSNDGNTLSDVDWGNGINIDTTVDGKTLIQALHELTLSNNSKPFESCTTAADVAGALKEVADKSETVQKFAETVEKYLNNVNKQSVNPISGSDGSYQATGLEAGYYLVQDSALDVTGLKPSDLIVELVGNVTVEAKVGMATVNKYAGEETLTDNTSYGLGAQVPYTIVGTLPADYDKDTSTNYVYQFEDTMDEYLTSGVDWTYDQANRTQVTGGVTVSLVNGTTTTNITGNFTITYDNNKLTVKCANLETIEGVDKDSKIIVTYNATLSSDSVDASGITNKVILTYSGRTTTEIEETIFPVNLKVVKQDGQTETIKLAGAEFKLYRKSQDNGVEVVKYLKVDETTNAITWIDGKDAATTLTTDANGEISVKGLATGEYYLKETKAPDGYNKLDADVKMVISGTVVKDNTGKLTLNELSITTDGGNGTADKNTNTVTVTVSNNKGAILPSTGGIGTTIFYVIGGVLVIGAAVVLIVRRRMNAE